MAVHVFGIGEVKFNTCVRILTTFYVIYYNQLKKNAFIVSALWEKPLNESLLSNASEARRPVPCMCGISIFV